MAIIVKPIDAIFKVVLTHEDEKVELHIKQLDYKTKSYITGLVTKVNQGQITIDSALTCFYNIKFGLKKVVGIVDEEGKPYELQFEDKQKKELTDECVDMLLATELSDNIQYTARELSKACYPSQVLHPLNNQPIEGIEVIPASQLKGTKKKS